MASRCHTAIAQHWCAGGWLVLGHGDDGVEHLVDAMASLGRYVAQTACEAVAVTEIAQLVVRGEGVVRASVRLHNKQHDGKRR